MKKWMSSCRRKRDQRKIITRLYADRNDPIDRKLDDEMGVGDTIAGTVSFKK